MTENANRLWLSKEVKDMVKDLKDKYPELTTSEALNSALQRQKNSMIKRAFVLTKTDHVPTALEKIVLSLEDQTNAVSFLAEILADDDRLTYISEDKV